MSGQIQLGDTDTRREKPENFEPAAAARPKNLVTAPSFEWQVPRGHKRSLRWLTEDEVLKIHNMLVEDFAGRENPIDPPGVRSADLFASALFRPKTAIGNTLKYSTVETSAAALLHSIIQDHPFHNGNKRTGLVAMLVFLDENGLFPTCNQRYNRKLWIDKYERILSLE